MIFIVALLIIDNVFLLLLLPSQKTKARNYSMNVQQKG